MVTDMNENLLAARQHFISGLSRISRFWGFPRAMGAIYGSLYLSPGPLCLDELVDQARVTKGAISTNVRALERLGMVHKKVRIGERRDFYSAETDFWKITKGILKEREKSEFDHALRTVDESLALTQEPGVSPDDAELAAFYQQRLGAIQGFFRSLDKIVNLVLTFDQLRASTIDRLLRAKGDDAS